MFCLGSVFTKAKNGNFVFVFVWVFWGIFERIFCSVFLGGWGFLFVYFGVFLCFGFFRGFFVFAGFFSLNINFEQNLLVSMDNTGKS